jgi:hypothetical protein
MKNLRNTDYIEGTIKFSRWTQNHLTFRLMTIELGAALNHSIEFWGWGIKPNCNIQVKFLACFNVCPSLATIIEYDNNLLGLEGHK